MRDIVRGRNGRHALTKPVETLPALFSQLTAREQLFILHPLIMTDVVQAAKDAGYSKSTAESKAYTMRKQLMYYIRPVEDRRLAAVGSTADRVRAELAAIAYANEANYFDVVDTDTETIRVYKDPTRLPEHMQRAIKSINYETIEWTDKDGTRFSEQRISSISLYSKLDALKELAEIHGLHDPRQRQPETPGNEGQQLLDNLAPEELEIITRLYDTAAARAKALANKKRDAQAIPGEVNVKEKA